jgi:hypothetical protein
MTNLFNKLKINKTSFMLQNKFKFFKFNLVKQIKLELNLMV